MRFQTTITHTGVQILRLKRIVSHRLVLWTIIAVLGAAAGCRKNSNYQADHDPGSDLQLLNTGYYRNTSAQKYHPVYWLDSTLHELPAPPGVSAYAYGLDFCMS